MRAPTAATSAGPRVGAPVWARVLADVPVVADLLPAVVVGVDERAFHAVTAAGALLTVEWDGMTWARRYIDVDRRGVRPRAAADVVTVGDIVRVQRREESGWRLAQVPDIQGALVALRPRSGAVAALAGGYDFWHNQFDHARRAARQPGSGFKPFVYSAALARGVTPSSIFLDAPLVFEDTQFEKAYRPGNDSERYNGPTRLREALYRSINLVTMRVLLEVGVDGVLRHARRFGFDTAGFPRDTQLAIGGGTMAVTPLDMARGYAVIANGGYGVEPHIVRRVVTRDGTLVLEPSHAEVREAEASPAVAAGPGEGCRNGVPEGASGPEPSCRPLAGDGGPAAGAPSAESLEGLAAAAPAPVAAAAPQVVDERNVFILHSMLRDVIERGTGRRARTLGRGDIAGKTGTTNEAADTWFNGYNDDLVASVWVGFGNYRPLGRREYGSTTPLSVWMEFMGEALEGVPERDRATPQGVAIVKIDPATGEAAAPNRPDAIVEYFLEETAPVAPESGTDGPLEPEQIF